MFVGNLSGGFSDKFCTSLWTAQNYALVRVKSTKNGLVDQYFTCRDKYFQSPRYHLKQMIEKK